MIQTQFKKIHVLHNLNLPTSLVSSLLLRMHKFKDLPYRGYHYPWKQTPMWSEHQCDAQMWPCALSAMFVNEGLYISISCSGPSHGDRSPRLQPPLLSRLLSIVETFHFFSFSASFFVAVAETFISRDMLTKPMKLLVIRSQSILLAIGRISSRLMDMFWASEAELLSWSMFQ